MVARRTVLAICTVKTVDNGYCSQGNLVESESDCVYGKEEGYNSRNDRDRCEVTMGK